MIGEKWIKNISPYNDPQNYTGGTEYVDCFYSALFAFLASNNKDILPYIANNIFYYDYSSKQDDLRLKYGIKTMSSLGLEEINEKQGIRIIEERVLSEDIIEYIKGSIDENKMISVGVDMFELSYRPDRYKKIHTSHMLIVYGYNNVNQQFYILDNIDNSKYIETKCTFSDLQTSYTSLYKTCDEPLSCVYENTSGIESSYYDMKDYRSVFINNYMEHQKLVLKSLDCLKFLEQEVRCILLDLHKNGEKSIELFYLIHYHILNVKRAELYSFYRLLGIETLLGDFRNIIMLWEKIRVNVYRCVQNKKITKNKINEICDGINNVYTIEKSFYTKMYKSIKDNNLNKEY